MFIITLLILLFLFRCVWPLSLLAYKATAKSLCIPQFLPAEEQPPQTDDMGDLAYCYRLHVKPKKRHEIDNLAKVQIVDDYKG